MTTRTLTQNVQQWLEQFESALDRRDIRQVMSMFGEECYWRDLVAFTWNLKTMEGKDEIQSMLDATLARAQPGYWRIEGMPPSPTVSSKPGSPSRPLKRRVVDWYA
ncbi:hypothetical protein A8U91_00473 [Halomonas elongata]|uniref:Uncharacterized protein n=1 Tax=Halomonas elongata TaxID=2746 RepID=A0A1B8P1K3_HALEL|nr:hypothetical protein A8U91_00473 [Halomonas elongata]